MDFLKENVGLQGWAERDPKNVYKKEGYEMFVKTLAGIRDRVTDRVFRLEASDEEEARSIYQITAAIHEEFADFEAQQQQAMEGASAGAAGKVAPIVIDGPKVGRNDPCPCGSGKKYKKCHGSNA
jgi:preprotein translocase subunit SecA